MPNFGFNRHQSAGTVGKAERDGLRRAIARRFDGGRDKGRHSHEQVSSDVSARMCGRVLRRGVCRSANADPCRSGSVFAKLVGSGSRAGSGSRVSAMTPTGTSARESLLQTLARRCLLELWHCRLCPDLRRRHCRHGTAARGDRHGRHSGAARTDQKEREMGSESIFIHEQGPGGGEFGTVPWQSTQRCAGHRPTPRHRK
jgi:hypothetical protein